MPDGEIRQIQIRGDAVAAYTKERKTRRTTRKNPRDEVQKGGDDVPGPSISGRANYARAANISKQLQQGGAPLSVTTPPVAVAATPAIAAAAAMRTLPLLADATGRQVPTVPMMSGGEAPMQKTVMASQAGGSGSAAKPVAKLVLAPAKTKATRKALLLTPPGKRATKAPTKGTRKIRMQLAGLKKRLTRSRDISKESRDKPVEVIRQELVTAKLIREKSTVPEPVMRDIWRDYQTLRGRAL
jgi:hypothetical protein